MKEEKTFEPRSGFPMLLLTFLILFGTIAALIVTQMPIFALFFLAFFIMLLGFFVINPNSSRVMVFFGDYRGTVKKNGFFWANPFYSKKKVSLRAYNFDSERLKVNDKLGNPIMISVILVWQVKNTYKAMFEVNNYEHFVRVQSDAAVRKLGGSYAYDNFEDDGEITLRSGMNEVNHDLEEELRERLAMAGIDVIEARIGYLAYAEEIASAMLQRQQATAIVAARQKIVEGAVGMVEMALDELNQKSIVELDEEKKAAMVSNLMVVLCSDRAVTPVVNTGTLNH
ncbi:membrane protein [Roseivirga seohaensis subsp. aquiponti]|uniref:Membrane protein n=1 Tax=Roseivirga seohaensis subsp. aquiponti TaxID=1566026 RepID=A0A0L8AIJ3_9BACT|nr:SPFH domain-containing protein [Roseivirga seohaensis]KOF02214.1 membrane protein [Roseivirga seohaensis subsp. aquiponti]